MLCGSGLQLAAEEEEDDPQPLGDDGDEGTLADTDSVPTDDSSFDVTQSEPSEGEFIRNLTSLSNNFLSTVLDLFVMKFVCQNGQCPQNHQYTSHLYSTLP